MESESFFVWLSRQTERQDNVGTFARYAVKDKIFPRHAWRLHIFLLRYENLPVQRAAVKIAHREWRNTRKAAA